MKEETLIIKYLITKISFIRIFNRSKFLTELKTSKSLDQDLVDLIILKFGNITIQDLINLYDLAKTKIVNSSRNRIEMLRVWNAIETDSRIIWGQYERNISHIIYKKMTAELFGG